MENAWTVILLRNESDELSLKEKRNHRQEPLVPPSLMQSVEQADI